MEQVNLALLKKEWCNGHCPERLRRSWARAGRITMKELPELELLPSVQRRLIAYANPRDYQNAGKSL